MNFIRFVLDSLYKMVYIRSFLDLFQIFLGYYIWCMNNVMGVLNFLLLDFYEF